MKYLILMTLFLTACNCPPKAQCHQEMVKAVGGCDRSAECAVLLENGEVSVALYPVAGAPSEVCICNGKYNKADRYRAYNRCK